MTTVKRIGDDAAPGGTREDQGCRFLTIVVALIHLHPDDLEDLAGDKGERARTRHPAGLGGSIGAHDEERAAVAAFAGSVQLTVT